MDSATLERLVAWLGEHPIAAGAVIFAVAFCDALVILGIAVPALPILFGVGTLVGLGHIDGVYAVLAAGLGAFCGDGVSYLVGRRYGDGLRRMWPFSRHPDWLFSGEVFFRRHGLKGIVIARFVGAVRPFVPAIAGMLKMPAGRYGAASLFASLAWGVAFVVPGWLFGASLDLIAAIAGRLALVLGMLLMVLLAIYALTTSLYGLLAPRAATMLERALAWSHRHPVLGRVSGSLIDPNRPESASLLLLALLLIGAGWAFFSLLIAVVGSGDSLGIDIAVHQAMFSLRTPLADHLMAMLASLGDWQVLGAGAAIVFAWLLWRRRTTAAWHWLAAIGFGMVLVLSLGVLLHMPKPPAATAVAGFTFPSAQVTMSTVVYGFFAVLIARELPGRKRAWPYVLAGFLVALVGFARLYFGAHWLSDVLAGIALGLGWIAGLGIAYRRRVTRSFWVRPIAALFFGTIAVVGAWHGTRSADDTLARFDPPLMTIPVSHEDWWREDWRVLPSTRNELSARRAWPLNVQYAGSLSALADRLRREGWREVPRNGWDGLLRSLDKQATPQTLPVLPASHNGRPEALLMARREQGDDGRQLVLRLWPSPLRIDGDDVPVWQGSVAQLRFDRRLSLLSLWEMDGGYAEGRAAVRAAAGDFRSRQAQRYDDEEPVLLLSQPPF